jgi:hypothetical protein
VKRISKAAVLTVAAGAAIFAGAGGAVANGHGHGHGHGRNHAEGAFAEAAAVGSPGFLSGNVFQVPIHMPINFCGNSLNPAGGLGNAALGNTCVIA